MPTVRRVVRPWETPPQPRKMPKLFPVGGGLDPNFYRLAPWLRLRKQRLDLEPHCRTCWANKRVTIAQMVDHIQPIRLGGAPLELDNTQSLCHKCHAKKSRGERGKTRADYPEPNRASQDQPESDR